MERREYIILVDGDCHRRAAICHALLSAGMHVEPIEHVAELTEQRWPQSATVLAEDSDNNVIELVAGMQQADHWLPIVAFAETPSTHQVVQAIANGAVDYLNWPCDQSIVRSAVRVARARGEALGVVKFRKERALKRLQKLTKRETEVLVGIADGLTNRGISERLSISPRTVEIHRGNMMHKMSFSHIAEAIRVAVDAALVD